MFTSHDWRGRHRQAARNLSIAVASAVLAGGAAAMAADPGTPSPTRSAADGAGCAKPGAKGERLPLAPDDAIVTEVRTRLQALVADGAIEQAEADAVLHEVIAGSVDMGALVRAGTVAAAHVATIDEVLTDVKRASLAAGSGEKPDTPATAAAARRAKAAAVRRAKAEAGG
ncbi:MAG TPA: hypothetical protein VK501_27570 [Baekduia sp.]|uniref:hypothetical protein n=1 Tax=Baekduia sp. TaxID=2600305 RepID=UPI002B5159E3|nr:hypothetical protein [Baekduia sp.]HMJ37697.1 hypothetical protein [Baekduia sp.]